MRLKYENIETCVYLLPTCDEFIEKFKNVVPDIEMEDIFDIESFDMEDPLRRKILIVCEKYCGTCSASEVPEDAKVILRTKVPGQCIGVSFTFSNFEISQLTPELLTTLEEILKV